MSKQSTRRTRKARKAKKAINRSLGRKQKGGNIEMCNDFLDNLQQKVLALKGVANDLNVAMKGNMALNNNNNNSNNNNEVFSLRFVMKEMNDLNEDIKESKQHIIDAEQVYNNMYGQMKEYYDDAKEKDDPELDSLLDAFGAMNL